jgi:hypothetical protein
MRAAAKIETRGVPIDVERLALLRARWADIQGGLIREIDRDFGVYDGNHFRADRFAQWLAARRIAWPHLPSGRLELSHDTFREMVRRYPELEPLKELRSSLSQMRLEQIAVGADGRNRTMLSAFQARTGRNQPSNTQFIFGPAVWLRRLIVPPPGFGLAYIDWSQQEFGIAAALSGDPRMLHAYSSGDPYLTFAKQAGAVPADATKESHKVERDRFKACVLAVQYGMGRDALALRIGCTPTEARELLQAHREAYARFWGWSDGAVDVAMFTGRLWTVFGWQVSVTSNTNARSLRNFPMQANGAEMLRLACCHITEAGIGLCAPIHDAVLVEAPAHDLGRAVAATQEAMAQASEEVLGGVRLRTDVKAVMHPARYSDERGERMWKAVEAALDGTGLWTGAPKDPGVDADPANLLSLCSS